MSSFEDAHVWWVLAPLWLLWVGVWWRVRQSHGRRATWRVGFVEPVLESYTESRWQRAGRWLAWLRPAVLALLVLAMGRPQHASGEVVDHTKGVAIVLCVDASGSMRALDLDTGKPLPKRRDRLDVVKDVVRRFVTRREHDQVGLVVFGSEAYTQSPLTTDRELVARTLDVVELGIAGTSTAIGSALGSAIRRLEDAQARSKVVVLLTDGVNNAGQVPPLQAAEAAKALGIRVYTVGAGTRGEAPVREVHPWLGERYVTEQVEIDEDTLREVAELTGGRYFRAEDADALEAVYAEIDNLEKSTLRGPQYRRVTERYAGLLGAALALLVLEIVLWQTRLRRAP